LVIFSKRKQTKNLDWNGKSSKNKKTIYIYRCGKWLSKKNKDDKQIIRELPAKGLRISRSLSVVKYMVDVYIGNKANTGTNGNVFLLIYLVNVMI
jgi:hypothetical protein